MGFCINHPEHGNIFVHEMPLYGIERAMGIDPALPETHDRIAFKLYDDDGNFVYGGNLHDDPECENQSAALRYGEADEGATTIKVKRNGAWVQEIA